MLVDTVKTVAKSVIPTDAVGVFATAYPDLKAATAGYRAGDLEYVVSIQQLSAPFGLADITANEPEKSGSRRLTFLRPPDWRYSQQRRDS